ncbi:MULTISPECIES: flagellar basal body P-ring protein FlgI [Bartonella]|uniref:Flagellar P-ring protein n=3 Tax=Bartonella TaxID=773 RepID=E6Z141_BARSR|nr:MULTISPECIES: flagellar basal body P-ring protein FlgI [Bartonella]AQX31235.1 flagellar P-ring protein precursor FlgI [Bartonella schoenbuchensis R1]MBA9083363.1 flagellar P-ring protein precursor FlgI [Bartonella chomelii]CBI82829.1 Flagellar P-ring protein [Bartonella schoenbuchensis R1]CDP80549.1 Basal body P-ring protein [Bartonella schoenbuchensis]
MVTRSLSRFFFASLIGFFPVFIPAFADEGGKNVEQYTSPAAADAAWLGAGGDPAKMHYADLARPGAVARLKDIAEIQGVRSNQLVGYGLVIGLNGTGDSLRNAPFTEQAMRAMLDNLGMSPPAGASRANNIAAVIVTAEMVPFATPGSRIDVTVSALGDATSLQGGTLVMTPLLGADGKTYAVAQGNMVISGFGAQGVAESVTQGVPTSGRIPNGALVEQKIEGNFNQGNEVILELRNSDFSTAVRVSDLINIFANKRYKHNVAKERDAKTVVLNKPRNISMARFIAEIEMLPIPTDEVARVVVDERTGTVVIGEKVRVSRVAISHGSLTVRVTEEPEVSQPNPFSDGDTVVVPRTSVDVDQPVSNIGILDGVDLDNLIKGLNQIGVKPTAIIAVLQAIKTAGALHAELVVQ